MFREKSTSALGLYLSPWVPRSSVDVTCPPTSYYCTELMIGTCPNSVKIAIAAAFLAIFFLNWDISACTRAWVHVLFSVDDLTLSIIVILYISAMVHMHT